MAWILGENGNGMVFSWIDESFISSNLGEMRDGGKMLKEKKMIMMQIKVAEK